MQSRVDIGKRIINAEAGAKKAFHRVEPVHLLTGQKRPYFWPDPNWYRKEKSERSSWYLAKRTLSRGPHTIRLHLTCLASLVKQVNRSVMQIQVRTSRSMYHLPLSTDGRIRK
jgi:hypothetical protein